MTTEEIQKNTEEKVEANPSASSGQAPATPVEPAPAAPAAPATPATPDAPATPATPATPDAPATPAKNADTTRSTGSASSPQAGSGHAKHPADTRGDNKKPFKRNPRRERRPGRERAKPEFDQKIVSIRRVTRVMAGGRRFSFSVSLVTGNRKGKVGVGVGKAGDTALAIEKAFKAAKKTMITIPLTKNKSIRHDVSAKYCGSVIRIQPAEGRGLVAGGAIRTVLELGGITDVTSKILSRSKNHLNNARAALKALLQLSK